MGGLITSSIARKVTMALSGLFLVLFLLQHFSINFTSVFSPDLFNEISHFMGTNPVVQFILQPILIFAVIFHFIMGFILELRNNKARVNKYVKYNGNANASWMSRNMIISGLVVLAFLGLHFYDFWFPEIVHKYVETHDPSPERYYDDLVNKFESPVRTGLYALSFIFLALHLWHGFASSFQTVGFNNKYSVAAVKFAKAFAVVIPLGFVAIALVHFFNN
ncbi:succinate dehydrogenase cytochrome b subunit [Aquimarina sp. ERC-38]|uniref:succinate dehydrogenase cytochrome b subunit n=1 Tax=Aquimarina sp. ERC-38 TaxID=2949996 RepID=UPI002245A0C1|nr:succinate dehydrogenase cytochrome b subunit [Aquimarina sp. ERC-38]UZO81921.1 succinate dehydrogenase cytochrome b subunit [Aquimarina sp. ERC-38]